jgi:hypothetical protein
MFFNVLLGARCGLSRLSIVRFSMSTEWCRVVLIEASHHTTERR